MKGKKNIVTDALSRMPTFCSMSFITADWKVAIIAEYAMNTSASNILDGSVKDDRCIVADGFILYKNRILLVSESTMKEKIMRTLHDEPMASHPSFYKTYKQLNERFTWKALKEDVLRHIRKCTTCQHNKEDHTILPVGLLQPLRIPNQKWGSISMDFITGKDYILS